MPQIFILTLGLLPWMPAVLCGVTTEKQFAVLEGRSLTIPCHYEPQYASYVKYWCRGKMREFCTSLARTDDTGAANPAVAKVSIFDDPMQQVFTVTMNNLQEGDSGWYMCGVEIGGVWSADVVEYTKLEVIHGMSMVNGRLSGEEGSSVKAECLYSEKYRDSEKKWCRSGNWNCLSTGSDRSYEDTAVTIADDRTGAFTVTLKKLQMKDTGWYWCCAGQQQISVHLLVTPRPTTTAVSVISPPAQSPAPADLPPPKPVTKESWNKHSHILESLLVCASVMVLVGLAILARKLWKMHHRDPVLRRVKEMKARLGEYGDVGDLQHAAVVLLNEDSRA